MTMVRRGIVWLSLLGLVSGCGAAPLPAQVPPGGAGAPPPPAAGDAGPGIVREKTVYVPFDKLDTVFEKEGRGIFLPYEEFLKLWHAAQPGPPPPPPDVPPADAVIRGAAYKGAVEGDVARLEASFGLEALKKGWSEILLPLAGAAVEEIVLVGSSSPAAAATVPGPAREALVAAREKGYAAYLPGPGRWEARLKLSARVERAAGKRSVRFGIPAAAVSRLELRIPEEDVRVDVEPSLAVSQAAAEDRATRVVAYLGNATEVVVSWMPPPGKPGEAGAIVSAEQSARVYLGERTLRIATEIDYRVVRGEADAFRVRLPDDTRLLAVKGENIREWTQQPLEGGGQAVAVRLYSAVKDAYRLALSFERILERVPPALAVPFPRALDVLRESGYAVLGHDSGLNVRVTAAPGLSQLDPEDVPEALRAGMEVGFRYLAHPLGLELAVEQITPVVRAQTTSVVMLGKEDDVWIGRIDYDITKAGVFRLVFRVPATWNVETAGDPATVEEFQTADEGGRRTVTVSLKSRALGAFQLPFRLRRNGTAAPGEASLSPPEIVGAAQDRGLFGVAGPRAFELVTLAREPLVDADADELFRTGILAQLGAEAGLPRAFRYRDGPASVRLRLEAKKTEVEVLAQHLVEVADGEIRVTHLLDYNILYAPVNALRFRAPTSLDETLKVEAKEKTEALRIESNAGLTLWEVKLQRPGLGGITLSLHHSQDLKALKAGEPFTYAVPLVHAVDARESGFVAVRKEGTLEIAPAPAEMETIDTGDLPDKLRRGQIYSAFRYFASSPALALQLTRHDYQRLATAAVELIHMKSVLTEERKLRTLATLFVQNTERQYLELGVRPEHILSLAVAGRTQSAKKAKDGAATLVDIPHSAGPGGTFAVTILYDEPLAASAMGSFGNAALKTLEVRDGVPVSRVELELYLPADYAYLAWRGGLNERDAGTPSFWERFKRLLETTPAMPPAAAREAPAATPPSGAAGTAAGAVVINLPTEGLARRDFETLAPTGTLAFTYAGRRLFSFLDFLCFLAALAGGWYLLARRPWPRLRIGLAIVLVPLTLSWFASGPITEVLASLTAGSILAVVGFLAMQLTAQLREQRAARLALAPDPFLEEAAARPSARPGAPAAHPAPPPPAAPTSPPAAEEKSEDAPGTPGTPPPDSPPSKRKKKED